MTTYCFGQENLIVNGNCDSISSCPDNSGEINKCYGWQDYSVVNSSDLLNFCSSDNFAGIPSDLGYQLPHSGNGYIHIIPLMLSEDFIYKSRYYSDPDTTLTVEYRESVIGTLKEPLKNQYYRFECYINYSSFSTSATDKRLALNSFDLKLLDSVQHPLTCTPLHMDTTGMINLNPSNQILDDTLNWVKLSVCFEANGGESFFAIGCMRDSSLISYIYSGDVNQPDQFLASYYFDSFSLIECDTCCGRIPPTEPISEDLLIMNSAGTSANPITFQPIFEGNTTANLIIYDSRGRLVLEHRR
jgi:hypothetical protein